jgi:plasmid stabilization system protein ParE
MREVVWAKLASRDLNKILAYIAESSEQNATLVGDRLERTAASLGVLAIGRFGRVKDTYEVPVPKTTHTISYAKTETTITILRVIADDRPWEAGSWPVDDA